MFYFICINHVLIFVMNLFVLIILELDLLILVICYISVIFVINDNNIGIIT